MSDFDKLLELLRKSTIHYDVTYDKSGNCIDIFESADMVSFLFNSYGEIL
jgi:hypothetical protein